MKVGLKCLFCFLFSGEKIGNEQTRFAAASTDTVVVDHPRPGFAK